jgi:hypothetical protein
MPFRKRLKVSRQVGDAHRSQPSLRRRALQARIWTIGQHASESGTRLISNLIMSRLLEAFGVVRPYPDHRPAADKRFRHPYGDHSKPSRGRDDFLLAPSAWAIAAPILVGDILRTVLSQVVAPALRMAFKWQKKTVSRRSFVS